MTDTPMKIACPNCATSYDVAAASIGEAGRSVRCVRCRSIWFVSSQAEPVAAVPAQAAPAAASAPPPAAASGGLDDMAAWGLSDDASPPAAASRSMLSAQADFDPTAMLNDIEGPISVSQAPPIAPVDAWPIDDDDDVPHAAAPSEHEFKRPGDRPPAKRKLPRPTAGTAIMVLGAILIGIIGWRADVVRVMPQTASLFAAIGMPVNLRGLAIENVRTSKEVQEGVPVLVIEGEIANISRMMLEVPRVRLALRNSAGAEVYNWTALPPKQVLAPNEFQPFRTRLASPPAEGRDVLIRFFNRRDAIGGLK